ncbi:hypothetical protein OSTOST_22385 [Ostertagia ostertagi]
MDFSAKTIPPKEAQEEFKSVINTSIDTYKSFIPFIKTSSYEKLVRITSYVLKYISILWRKSRKGESTEENSHRIITLMSETQTITTSDRKAAEILLLREHYREEVLQLQGRIVQRLQVSMCDDGIYRGDLRMANAEILDTAKNPILLLPNHQLTRLIVTDFHQKLFHAGVSHLISELRNHYLIPRVRRVVNAVIEATLNTRPITPVTTDSTEDSFVLRPIDLINPYFTPPNSGAFNSSDRSIISDSHEEIINSYVLLQDTLNTFWNHWQKEYLQNLAERNQKRSTLRQGAKHMPKVGDVVLIKTENTQRSQWPLGLIIQINESVDGSVRSVRIKTGNNKVLDRSVNQLIPLEVCAADTKDLLQTKKKHLPTRIQPDRAAKRRVFVAIMSSPGGSPKKDAPSAPRGWSRRRGARDSPLRSRLVSLRFNPGVQLVHVPRPHARRAKEELEVLHRSRIPYSTCRGHSKCKLKRQDFTAEASKKEKKEQKKQESESSSGVEKQSVEKEKNEATRGRDGHIRSSSGRKLSTARRQPKRLGAQHS